MARCCWCGEETENYYYAENWEYGKVFVRCRECDEPEGGGVSVPEAQEQIRQHQDNSRQYQVRQRQRG